MIQADVCVVGGGPSGSAFALQMARLGYRVCVVERYAFPRRHVGESLTPGVWPLLEALGVREEVEAAGFLPSLEARVRWAEETGLQVRAPMGQAGLLVDRGRFDRLLLEAAERVGAQVMQPATAGRPVRVDGGWDVSLRRGAETLVVRARFVADASGRAFVLGGEKRPSAVRTLALFGYWRGEGFGTETRVEAGPDAWLWGAPLPDGTFNAMAFVDPEWVRARGVQKAGLEGFYRELLGSSELLSGLAQARLEGAVIACDATCYADPEPIGDDFIKLGEAGFAIDPLSSAGVQKALQTALCGSTVVHTLLSRPGNAEEAREFYRENQRASVEQHGAWAAGYYHENMRYAERPFWARRSRPPAATPPPVEPAPPPDGPLLELRVRLAPEAALVSTPCLVGEWVERRRALTHPGLKRPVAYLGQVELVPLLEAVGDGAALGQLIQAWTRRIPLETGMNIAQWLVRNGVLVFETAPRVSIAV